MAEQQNVDIVIAGAGMVGLSLAASLAPTGMRIALVEQRTDSVAEQLEQINQQQQQGHDPRVSALTCASTQILTSVGAWEKMQAYRLSPYTDMDVWDGEGTGHIHFSAQDIHEPVLGHIVENRVTLAGLLEVIQNFDNIQWLTGSQIKEISDCNNTGCKIQLEDERIISAGLIVAADGALSKTRHLAGIPMWEWDYGHHAIVTTITTEKPHQKTAWQRFTDTGPLAFLPLSNSDELEQTCSIVWSTTPTHAKQLMTLADDSFCDELGKHFEYRLGKILHADPRFVFPLRQRHAQFYVKSGFAVIGDAAHTIHPLAGQGVNLGLLDAAQLAQNIIEAMEQGQHIGSIQTLEKFQRIRRVSNLRMSASMEGFKRLFNQKQPIIHLARNMGMNILEQLPMLKRPIMLSAMGIAGSLPQQAERPIKD